MKQTFSIREAIKTGWEVFKENWKFLVVLGLVIGLVNVVAQLLMLIPVIGIILQNVLSAILTLGTIHILLQLYDKKEVSYSDLFSQLDKFWTYAGAVAVGSLIIGGGFALLVVPGFIAIFALVPMMYLVVDRKTGIMETIRASWAMTKGSRGRLALFALVSLGIVLLGVLALGFGLLVAIPVVSIAGVHIYRKLLANAEANNLLNIEKLQTAPKAFMAVAIVVLIALAIGGGMLLQSEGGNSFMNGMISGQDFDGTHNLQFDDFVNE